MIGEEREVHFDANCVDDGASHAEGDRECRRPLRGGHEPKPRVLLAIWPMRKFAQIRNASSSVVCRRAAAYCSDSGCRQNAQYAGSRMSPMVARCSFISNTPTVLKNRSCSSARRAVKRYSV